MGGQVPLFYEFGPFRLIPDERQLLREGRRVTLPPKAFDTLLILVERSGHIVRKDELIQTVWPDAFVEENNLNQYVSLLRKALGNGNDADAYIETVRRYGYRFTADVRVSGEEAHETLHQRTRTRVVVKEETSHEVRHTRVEPDATSILGHQRLSTRRKLAFGILISGTVLAGVALATLLWRGTGESKQPTATATVRSVAVLPFRSIKAPAEDEYLGLSIADALITRFGQIRQLNVRPTSAVQKYASEARDPLAVGRELKVDAVLDGRFQKSADQIRVTAQLVSVSDGTLLWSGEFDERATSLLAVQDSISEQAAQAMRLQLSAWERERLTKPATANPDAYQAYLKGRYFWNKRTAADINKAVENFQHAIDLDPNYALAYAGLADCYNLLSEYNGASPGESFGAAERAASNALELDESLAEAHTSLAYVLVNFRWDWKSGEREFKRAIELKPNYATAHQWYAEFLGSMGRLDEAEAELAHALECDPLSLIINAEQGQPFLVPGQYDRAIEKFRQATELDPNFGPAHAYLRIAYELSGRPEQAFSEALAEAKLDGWTPEAIEALKQTYKCCGLPGVWRQDLAYQMARRREASYSSYMIAQTYGRLGNKEQALSWLEHAYKEHDRYLIELSHDQQFAALRTDPRFRDLLRRMNLPS
jgi:DNA-binding winged helix-turn-helix (wHTH) protein/TolB-like protein/Tfp pilus assembly protein PilF